MIDSYLLICRSPLQLGTFHMQVNIHLNSVHVRAIFDILLLWEDF